MSARVRLGESRWYLWREVAVRGAGLPAERLDPFCDPELAAAADDLDGAGPDGRDQAQRHFDKVYDAAADRLLHAVRDLARDPWFREAVTWQNPKLVRFCLDQVAGGRRNAHGRYHERTITSYLQRYCLKNDTIGFFGPVGWAVLDPDAVGVELRPGSHRPVRRTTYFEYWPIDVLARVLAARADVLPFLTPTLAPGCSIVGDTVRLPALALRLDPVQSDLVRRCDGERTVGQLVGDPQAAAGAAVLRALLRLRSMGILRIGLHYDVTRRPERGLARRIERIPDPVVRERAMAPLRELVAARDVVAAAAGDPDRLLAATTALTAVFERHTATAATRHDGAMYVGRTPVYEDAVRGGEVRLGRAVLDVLGTALPPLLQSATWLADQVARRHLAAATEVVDRESPGAGPGAPLVQVLSLVLPEALSSPDPPRPAIVGDVVGAFQERWARILALPQTTTRRHRVDPAVVADGVAREFPVEQPAWSGARRHAPDLLVAADGPQAFVRGDFTLVLGELHVATATLESRLWAAQHPDVARLRQASREDHLRGRVVLCPDRTQGTWPTRMARSGALMLDEYTYVTTGDSPTAVPAGAVVLPVGDLVVTRRGEDLVVRRVSGGPDHPFLEVVGDLMTLVVLNAFRPLAPAPHRPRVTVGRLVLARETWTLDVGDAAWAFVRDEARRFAALRSWAAVLGLPDRVFAVVPVERKPLGVDLRSLALVNLLAAAVRRTAREGGGTVTVSEALPATDELWLADESGRRYTSELRFTAVHD